MHALRLSSIALVITQHISTVKFIKSIKIEIVLFLQKKIKKSFLIGDIRQISFFKNAIIHNDFLLLTTAYDIFRLVCKASVLLNFFCTISIFIYDI